MLLAYLNLGVFSIPACHQSFGLSALHAGGFRVQG